MTADPRGSAMLWRGLDAVPAGWGPCAVTIGVFDGMHRGHVDLIGRTVQAAEQGRIQTVLLTFDPHPGRVVGPTRDTSVLSTPDRRAQLAGPLGVDAVLVIKFTAEMARMPPEAFVRQVLVDRLRAQAVVVGGNFRFGAQGRGDVVVLQRLGQRYGFTTEGVDMLHVGDTRCSSTYIRTCLAKGDVGAAAQALGRPHRVEGRLLDHVLWVPPGTALPAGGRYRGVLSVPGHDPRLIEVLVERGAAHILSPRASPLGASLAALEFIEAS